MMIFRDHSDSKSIIIFLIIGIILLSLSYWKLPLHHEEFSSDSKWTFVSLPLSALTTYYLNNECGLGSVFAAGIVGTLGTYMYVLNPKSIVLKNIGTPIYCGAFIGMSTISISSIYYIIALASLFSSILFFYTKSMFVGVGGKLGTIAFIGVLLIMLLSKVI